jgi:VWFA-related protein
MTTAAAWLDIGAALQRMESVDRVFIYFLTNHGDLVPVHPLPSTDADLRAASSPSAAELRAKLDEAVRKLQGFRDIDTEDPVFRANTTFRALEALGAQTAALSGRKNLIWVTHGMPLAVWVMPQGEWVDFTPQIRRLSAAAAHSQIAIYTVQESEQGAGADPTSEARAALEMFSVLTGGRWYPSDNAAPAIAASIADGRGNYRVAYYSPIREKDRKEHKIRIESVRKGVRLLTRESYSSRSLEPAPEAVEAELFSTERRSPFDATEIGLRAGGTRNPDGKTVRFKIRVDPLDVLLERHGENYEGRLGLMLALYSDGFLKEMTAPIHADIRLSQEQYATALQDGIVIEKDAPVSDKIQKVRAMVFDQGLFGLGSVTFPAP